MKRAKHGISALIVIGLVAAAPMTAALAEDSGVDVGLLTCKNVPGSGLNLVIHSTVDIACEFKATDGKVEHYQGETGIGLGIDLKWNRDEVIYFTVATAAADISPGSHALAGRYVGGKASATLGVGAGAQALIGGSNDNIALKPALEESKGFGIAGGLSYLYLEAAKMAK